MQYQLLRQTSDLRLRNISALWLPAVSVEAQAQFQSDAAQSPFTAPTGTPLFAAPKQTYDSHLRVEQRLLDRTVDAQAALERAQHAEQQARVRAATYAVRQQVNEAFFAAAALQQRTNVLRASVAELEARLRDTAARVREGTALPADAAVVEATLLERRQSEDELVSNRRAALARLSTIVGRTIGADTELQLPELTAAVAQLRQAQQATGNGQQAASGRPEYSLFASTKTRVDQQRRLITAQSRPRLSAFARTGFGKPGLNFIEDEFQPYALGGLRLQWSAWTWGISGRERQALELQQRIVASDEAYFTRTLTESAVVDVEAIERLQRSLATDDRIVELRSQVERTARARMQEGVVTAADYVARNAELLQARFAQASHRIELAQASARLLTTLGVEVR
jgi:outer membrane protein TolC